MQAVEIDKFGDSSELQVRDIPVPSIDAGQVLVKVHATSVNPIDWKIRDGMMGDRYDDQFPQVLGFDASGVVADVGADVTEFAEGDEVYARSGIGAGRCYAEYVALNVHTVALKPEGLSHLEAAAMPMAALTPLVGFRDCANLKPGERVIIIGASGGVGLFALQIAKIMGADVTAVCSAANADLVKEMGPDRVIDYTREEVLKSGEHYDLIYDAVGSQDIEAAKKFLTRTGIYMTLAGVTGVDFFIPGQSERVAGSAYFMPWAPLAADLEILSGWVKEGRLRPVIDSEFALRDIRKAHEHSQTLRARGKIVIRIGND